MSLVSIPLRMEPIGIDPIKWRRPLFAQTMVDLANSANFLAVRKMAPISHCFVSLKGAPVDGETLTDTYSESPAGNRVVECLFRPSFRAEYLNVSVSYQAVRTRELTMETGQYEYTLPSVEIELLTLDAGTVVDAGILWDRLSYDNEWEPAEGRYRSREYSTQNIIVPVDGADVTDNRCLNVLGYPGELLRIRATCENVRISTLAVHEYVRPTQEQEFA